MKYKVGDKVKIREDLDTNKIYGSWDCSIDMTHYGGMVATIVNCYDDSYHIDIDNESYDWTDEMFEDKYIVIRPRNTIDVGYHLDGYGNRILKNVWYKGIRKDIGRIYFSDNVDINQYVLPTDAIDFIIPHED